MNAVTWWLILTGAVCSVFAPAAVRPLLNRAAGCWEWWAR